MHMKSKFNITQIQSIRGLTEKVQNPPFNNNFLMPFLNFSVSGTIIKSMNIDGAWNSIHMVHWYLRLVLYNKNLIKVPH